MDPWRLATTAQRRINALAGLALASCAVVWFASLGSASNGNTSAPSIDNTGAKPVVERHDASPPVHAEPANAPQLITLASASTGDVEAAPAAISRAGKAAATTADDYRYEPISLFEISLNDTTLPATEVATANTPDADLDLDNTPRTFGTIEINEECLVAEPCIDRYLWALYERAPKIDAIAVHEQRKVKIKRKGKMVTVTRTFTRRVDEEFAWKDPKAADKVGMSMMDYVIGGMDKGFKRKLFRTLLAAEAAGLSPGITSAFRDDYRQSIASGLKAASDRSYHGGSTRGGYGHGMAADIVSTQGNNRAQRWVSTEILWKWVDANGKAYGIGRPYLGRDPPHVGPVDGAEYISKRGTSERKEVASAKSKKTRAVAQAKPPKAQAAREQKSPAKPQKSAQSTGKRAT